MLYISEGEHDVEFKYEARGLKLGICVSAVTILALLVIFVVLRKKKPVATLLGGYSENGELLEYTVDFEGNISEKKPEEIEKESAEESPAESVEAEPEETNTETADEATENPTEE